MKQKAARKSKKAPAKEALRPKKSVAVKKTAPKVPVQRPADEEIVPQAKKKPVKLSAGERKKYREALESIRASISGQINFLADGSLNRAAYDVPADGGSEDFDRDFALSLLSSEHDVLFEIESALKRIEDNAYGACEKCTQPIAKTRLQAVPFARMCIHCQSSSERDRPRFHPLGETMATSTARPEPQGQAEPEE